MVNNDDRGKFCLSFYIYFFFASSLELELPFRNYRFRQLPMGPQRWRWEEDDEEEAIGQAEGRFARAEVGNVLRNLQQSLDETIGHPRRNTGYAGSNNSSALLLPGLLFSLPPLPALVSLSLSLTPSFSTSYSLSLLSIFCLYLLYISSLYGLSFSLREHFSSLPRIVHSNDDCR